MTPSDLRSQLEQERSWRHEEIVFFQNIGASLDEPQQEQYRRSLILIVYAHFEGFCKFALTAYISAINQEDLSCFRATPALAAATLHDVFKALKDPNSKSDFFRATAPDDRKLHIFHRDLEFIQRARDALRTTVCIPDSAVDMESNLKPVVLKKNLYRLGLSIETFDAHESSIGKLLGLRNNIAHGSTRRGIAIKEYEEVRDSALKVMDLMLRVIFDSFTNKNYMRRVA
jgi:hypothetical protein